MPKTPLPQRTFAWVNSSGLPTDIFANFMMQFAAGNFGPLTSAADDAAASKAGVAIGQVYENNGVVMVRKV